MTTYDVTNSNMKIEKLKYALHITQIISGCVLVTISVAVLIDCIWSGVTGRSYVVEPVLRLIIGG